jgi:PAS domain S-box-containing protein
MTDELRERFERLFDTTPTPLLVVAPDAPRFTVLHVNAAYLAATARARDELLGRALLEAFPDDPADKESKGSVHLRASLERVLATRRPDAMPEVRYDVRRPDGTFEVRWWGPVNAPVLGARGQVEAIIHQVVDVAARRRSDEALRAQAARDAFLVRLADALRPLADPVAVQVEAARVLGEHLGACRVHYAEVEADGVHSVIHRAYARGVPGIEGRHRLDAYGPPLLRTLQEGRLLRLDAVAEDARVDAAARAAWAALGIGAAITLPLVKGGRLTALISVHHAGPHPWTDAEVALIEAAAERTWDAVERARAEAALKESQRQLSLALEAARMGAFDRDLASDTLTITPASAELLGLPPGTTALTVRDVAALVHPDDLERHRAAFREAVAQGAEYHSEYRVVRPSDGRVVWLEERGRTTREPATGQARVTGVHWDVTARKDTEAALQRSEAQAREAAALAERERRMLDAVLEAVPAGIIVADARGGLLRENAANARLWGPSPQASGVEEYRQWKAWWADGSPRHGQPLAPREWAMARALGGEAVPGDVIAIEPFDAPGTRRVVVNSGAPIRDAAGAIVGAVVAQADVTALKESEARLQAILDGSPSIIFVKDLEGRYQLVNRAFCQVWQKRPEEVLGRTDGELTASPELAAQWKENDRQVLERQEPVIAEERADVPGGGSLYLSVKFALRTLEGQPYAVCGMSSDVTELRRVERERERLVELQEQMMGIVSHDVRSPLAALLMSAQALRRQPLEGPSRKVAERIERSARRVEQVVRLMLDFTRTRLGVAIPVEKRPVDLQEIASRVAEELQTARPERQVVLAGEPALGEGDPDRLFQALANLMENAFKYGEPGRPVTVTTREEREALVVEVHNWGEPIPEALQPRLFEPFSRGPQTEETVKISLGLGLYIVCQLVQAHGGGVSVRSTREEGTTFTLRLPRGDA